MRPRTPPRLVIAAILCLGAQTAVSAQVTRLDDVPQSLDEATRAAFQVEHGQLNGDRSDLGRRIKDFDQDCSRVRAGSPEDATCMRNYQVLDGNRLTYSSKVEDFNRRMRGATRDLVRGFQDVRGEAVWIVTTRIKGDVTFYFDGQPVEPDGLRLRVDRVVTGADSTFALELPDGHVMEIGPNSDINLDTESIDERRPVAVRLRKWVGSMLVKTGKLVPRRRGPFTIHTSNATMAVRGTQFVLRGEVGGSMTLGLIEGEIELLSAETGRATIVRPGDEIRIAADGTIETTRRSGQEIAAEWEQRVGNSEK